MTSKTPLILAGGAIAVALAATGGYWLGQRGASHAPEASGLTTASRGEAAKPARKLLYYRNPMGLPDTSPVPKKDPMGMDYIPVYEGEAMPGFQYEDLFEMLRGRKANPKEGSYTTYLFEKGLDKILKKVGEETTEVILAAKDRDKSNTIYEIGDLMYHCMVLMIESGIELDDIRREMASRHVIDHKVKQEKMVE